MAARSILLFLCLIAGLRGVAASTLDADLVAVPGGGFVMGDAQGEPDEAPRRASVGAFRMMRHEVTNRDYAAFVAATGHLSDPERRGFGYVWTGRWRRLAGADWRRPAGPNGGVSAAPDHPVVQVSARDAAAFCAWAGLRLPSETEWEFAARGETGRRYPWGAAPPQGSTQGSTQGSAKGRDGRRANFGTVECCAPDATDGYVGTAPVGRYPAGASPFGLLDMAGNVWEWTASRFPGRPEWVVLRGGGWGNNPYCLRTSYRHGNPPDIGLDMVGFRCAADTD